MYVYFNAFTQEHVRATVVARVISVHIRTLMLVLQAVKFDDAVINIIFLLVT